MSNKPKDEGNTSERPESSERPDEVLLKDLPIKITVIGWVSTCVVVLYLKSNGLIG